MSIGIAIMGLLVGFLVGLTGVGGATLLTPILIMMGIHPSIAVGSDFVYNSITKLFGAIRHWKQKTIHFTLMKYLAMGSIPSAVVAIVVLNVFKNVLHNEERIIQCSLGYVMILVSFITLTKIFFDKKMKPNRWQGKTMEEKRRLIISIGVIFGFVVGLTSIGSGSLFALAMLFLYRLNASEIVGTDIAHAFLLTTVAGMLQTSFGNVNYMLVANLLMGSIPGVLLGSALSPKLPAKPLRVMIAIFIIVSGVKMILK